MKKSIESHDYECGEYVNGKEYPVHFLVPVLDTLDICINLVVAAYEMGYFHCFLLVLILNHSLVSLEDKDSFLDNT